MENLALETPDRQLVIKYAGLDNSPQWKVTDSTPDGKLVLANYAKDNSDIPVENNEFLYVNSLIVESDKGIINNPKEIYKTIVDDNINFDKGLEILSGDEKIKITKSDVERVTASIDGFSMNVFRDNGVTYFSTQRRLFSNKSKFPGVKESFYELYIKAGGPSESELFDLNNDDSPYIYNFIVHSSQTLLFTKEFEAVDYVVYMGVKKRLDVDDNEDLESPLFDVDNYPEIRQLRELSDVEYNKFLKYGYTSNINLFEKDCCAMSYPEDDIELHKGTILQHMPGEVILIKLSNDNLPFTHIKVKSTGYNWREMMLENTTSFRSQAFRILDLLNDNLKIKVSEEYRSLFFSGIPYISFDELKQHIPFVYWPSTVKEVFDSQLDEAYANLLIATPPYMQMNVIEYIEDAKSVRQNISQKASFMMSKYKRRELDARINSSILGLINRARNDVKKEMETQKLGTTGINKYDQKVINQIKFLIERESGRSLNQIEKQLKNMQK